MKFYTQKGFTLVELLLVLAVIGILATIIVRGTTAARVKTRDATRYSDLLNLQLALSEYYSDHGYYPFSNNYTSFDNPTYGANLLYHNAAHTGTGQTLTTELAPYTDKLSDPVKATASTGYLYVNTKTGDDYCILFWGGPEDMRDFPSTVVPTTRCGTVTNGQCSAGSNSIYIGKGYYAPQTIAC